MHHSTYQRDPGSGVWKRLCDDGPTKRNDTKDPTFPFRAFVDCPACIAQSEKNHESQMLRNAKAGEIADRNAYLRERYPGETIKDCLRLEKSRRDARRRRVAEAKEFPGQGTAGRVE
jgi:hypothetical protein